MFWTTETLPILQYVCRVKLENIPKIIIACVVLHNIAKTLGDPDFEPVEEAPEENHTDANHHFDDNNNNELRFRLQGQEIRRNLSIIINNINDM